MLLKIKKILDKFKGIFRIAPSLEQQAKSIKLIKMQQCETTLPETKFEFPKLLIMLYSSFAIIWVNWYFILITLQLETGDMGMVVISIVEKIVYVVLVYFLYQGWMKSSRNKYGIDTDGIPYAVKGAYNSIFEDAPTSAAEKKEGILKDSDELSE